MSFDMDTKKCTICKEIKPVECFSKNKASKDGLTNQCKACANAYNKANYEANREKILERNKANYEANREKILERNEAYRQANREKIRERQKAHYEANKEKVKACCKAYREANKEKVKAYYEANKEKILERQKAYSKANKEKVKAYSKANKERKAAINSKYRASKRNAVPKHLRECPIEKERLTQIYRLRQVISEATGVEHHVDHMWPLSKGGPHWSGNLQIITAEENLSKNGTLDKKLKKVIQSALKEDRERYKHEPHDSIRY